MESPQTAETSVLFSLAELAEIEQERIAEEERLRAAARVEQARERERAEHARRAEEAAAAAVAAKERARRAHEQAETKARMEAQQRAAVDVARIQAEAKARLEADNAARAHELALIQARADDRGRRTRQWLAALLALSLFGGAAVTFHLADRVTKLELDNGRLRTDERSLHEARLESRRAALDALDRKHAALSSAEQASSLEEPRDAARRARDAIDPARLDDRALDLFRDALERWQAELEQARSLAALDQRLADLLAWATAARAETLVGNARQAASRARDVAGRDVALADYERALDELREALAQTGRGRGTGAGSRLGLPDGPRCTDPRDPLCGLDGKTL